MRIAPIVLTVWLISGVTASAQQADEAVAELREQVAALKVQIERLEAALRRLDTAAGASTPPERPAPAAAPALNTPPRLPTSGPEAFRKPAPRFDVLLQTRFESFASESERASTFRLRKAEIGVKGHITTNVDFSVELDPVRAADPFRRTYIRLAPHERLHVKLGLEKAPLGLEELTSSSAIPFVDRSEVNDRFAPAEELGIHVESRWTRWLFQASITNGNRRQPQDDNHNKAGTARVVWSPHSRMSLGAAALRSAAATGRRDRYNLELKLGSNLSGAQFEGYRADDNGVWSTAYYGSAYWAIPARTGWMTHIQPVVRYESILRSDSRRSEELGLLTSGFSLLFDQHRSKLQANYLWDVRTRGNRNEFRTQYQIEF
jgi:hypothetical protein